MHIISSLLCLGSVSGMLMYMPPTDPFETACFSTLGNLYEFGSACGPEEALTNNNRCPCSDDRFAKTVVSCIDQFVANVSSDSQSETRNASFQAFAATCTSYSLDQLYEYSANSSSLPAYDGDKQASKPGSWPVTQAFKPSTKEIKDALIVYYKQLNQEDVSKRYGSGLVAYWAGVMLIRGITHFGAQIFPMYVHRFHKIKLVRKFHGSFTLRAYRLYPITSFQMLVLCVFLVLTIVFSFIELGYWYPDNTTLYKNSQTYSRAIAMRTGVLALYLMPLFILFAGRNNFLLWLTGWSQDTFLLFHRWIARMAMVLIISHAIGYSINRVAMGTYSEEWNNMYFELGVVALFFGCFTVVQGMYWIRRKAYDLFIVLHIIAVILFIAGGYYHLKLNGEPLALYFFYTAIAVWGFDRAARLVRVVYFGCSKRRTEKGVTRTFGIPAVIELSEDTLVVTFDRPAAWNVLAFPGQFVYVHFLIWPVFWQSHPFTLVSSTNDPNKLKLFARVHKGITKRLADMTLKNGDLSKSSLSEERSCSRMTTTVLLDGPYGESHDLFEFDELIFVAGGTGITAPFSYIQGNVFRFPRGFQKIKLFWAVSNPSLERWFEEELRFLEEFKHIEVHIFVSRGCDCPRKLNIPEILGNALSEIRGPTCVLTCGPQTMNTDVKQLVAKFVPSTPHFLQYYEESFSF